MRLDKRTTRPIAKINHLIPDSNDSKHFCSTCKRYYSSRRRLPEYVKVIHDMAVFGYLALSDIRHPESLPDENYPNLCAVEYGKENLLIVLLSFFSE